MQATGQALNGMNARRETGAGNAASPGQSTVLPRTDVSISLRKLVLIRWVAVIGQAAALLVIHYGLGYRLPIESALAVVAASALLNAAASLPRSAGARLGDRAAALYLAYDTLQLGLLLYLTGGLQNPFAMLMLAPVTVSATILSRSSVIGLSALTVAAISVLAIVHLPLPSRVGTFFDPPPLYMPSRIASRGRRSHPRNDR